MKKYFVPQVGVVNRRQFLQLSANIGLLMVVTPDSAFAQGSEELVVAIPADLGGWDQDYLAFDLVGLAMFKNCYPYMIDYGVNPRVTHWLWIPRTLCRCLLNHGKAMQLAKCGL